MKRNIKSISNLIYKYQFKSYHPTKELMKKNVPEFFSDPNEIGEELVRIISLHDKIKDPIHFVECILQIENYLKYDFGASDWEQFLNINDIAQFLAKDYLAQKH